MVCHYARRSLDHRTKQAFVAASGNLCKLEALLYLLEISEGACKLKEEQLIQAHKDCRVLEQQGGWQRQNLQDLLTHIQHLEQEREHAYAQQQLCQCNVAQHEPPVRESLFNLNQNSKAAGRMHARFTNKSSTLKAGYNTLAFYCEKSLFVANHKTAVPVQ